MVNRRPSHWDISCPIISDTFLCCSSVLCGRCCAAAADGDDIMMTEMLKYGGCVCATGDVTEAD